MKLLGLAASAVLLMSANDSTRPHVELLSGADALTPLIQKMGTGGKPVVLHFFATWCATCRQETPIIRDALARARDTGATTAVVSLDDPQIRESKLPTYLAEEKLLTTAFLLDAPDPTPVTTLIDPKWEGDLPATFVFRDGRRVASFLGPLKDSRVLDEALKLPAVRR